MEGKDACLRRAATRRHGHVKRLSRAASADGEYPGEKKWVVESSPSWDDPSRKICVGWGLEIG